VMDVRQSLIHMIGQLLQDMQVIQHQGSGYYSCTPIARRYNKLLGQSRELFPKDNSIIATFEDIPEADPKDPSDKMKVLQSIRIESGQLTTLLESAREGDTR
jgi:hypothetical protein